MQSIPYGVAPGIEIRMAKKDPLSEVRRARFRDYCVERGWVNEDGTWMVVSIAAALNKKNAYVSNVLNGHGSFGATAAREFEDTLALEPGYFDSGEGGDFVDVPKVNARLAAGAGAQPEIEEVVGHLKFARALLRSCGVSAHGARVVDVHGASMEPTIRDGAVLLISTSNKEPVDNQIFALVRPTEGLIVKRLVRQAGQWIARSDNREFDDILIDDGEPITIIGRAVWMGAKL